MDAGDTRPLRTRAQAGGAGGGDLSSVRAVPGADLRLLPDSARCTRGGGGRGAEHLPARARRHPRRRASSLASAWLFTIARNVCRSRRLAALGRGRVETPRDLATIPEALLARKLDDADELVGLDEALAGMPPRLRRVLLLREWQGLSYRELAAELGTSQSAVETLLFRARRELARRLREPARRVRDLLGLGPLAGIRALFRDTAAVKLTAVAASAVVVSAASPGVIDRPVAGTPATPHPRIVVGRPAPGPTVAHRPFSPAPPALHRVAHVTVALRRPEPKSIEDRRTPQRPRAVSDASPSASPEGGHHADGARSGRTATHAEYCRGDLARRRDEPAANNPRPTAGRRARAVPDADPYPAAHGLPATSRFPSARPVAATVQSVVSNAAGGTGGAPVAPTVQSLAANAAAATGALPVPVAPSVDVSPPPVDLPSPPVDVPAPQAVPDPGAVVSDAQSAVSQVAPTVPPVPPPLP